jgi:hypothetical protein
MWGYDKMFRRRGFFRIVLVALLIGGLFSLGSYFGWMQGYNAGLAATDGGGGQAFGPYPYYGFGPLGVPFFFGFGLIFKLAFFFLIFMLFARLFRFGWWGMAHGPRRGYDSYSWPHEAPPWNREGRRPWTDDPPEDQVRSV